MANSMISTGNLRHRPVEGCGSGLVKGGLGSSAGWLVVLGVLLVGRGSVAAQNDCPTPITYAGPPTRTAPESAWGRPSRRPIDGELPRELQASLSRTLDEIVGRVPAASVAVAVPGQGLWSQTRGLAVTRPPTPIAPNEPFQVASLTKTFLAAVVLQLVDEGRLQLGATVERWFPKVPNAETMTIEHLLRHTSGLVSFNALASLGREYRSPRDAIALAAAAPPLFCPGASWSYSNTGYAMLGLIVEELEGAPLHEVLDKRLLRPLSLGRTALRQHGIDSTVATGHASGTPVDVQDGYATAYAAGALASTSADVVRFWHALLQGEIVSRDGLRAMFSAMAAMSKEEPSYYGMGAQMYDVPDGPGLMLGHSGGIVGFTSVVAYVVRDDIYVAVLFNDKDVPAEAGLWAMVRSVRAFRTEHAGKGPSRRDE